MSQHTRDTSDTDAAVTMPADGQTKVFDPASIALAGVILLAGLLMSFTHVHDVAYRHGWSKAASWAPPIVTELLAAASGVNIRWRLKAGLRNLAPPVVGVLLGLALSLGANEATATDGLGPAFARLPWGSILAVLMPGSGVLVLMMIEPMVTRSHAGRAAEAAHAQAVDVLTVVRSEIGEITAEVRARMTAFAEEARARTARLDAESRAHVDQTAHDARAQAQTIAKTVDARMAEFSEAVTDLAATVISVDATVAVSTAHVDDAGQKTSTTLADLVKTISTLNRQVAMATSREVRTPSAPALRAVTDGSQPDAHARKAEAARRMQDGTLRISGEEFIAGVVECMRTDPAWTPDYDELMRRTGYGLRWLQMRVAAARKQLVTHEITDAEIVDDEPVEPERH